MDIAELDYALPPERIAQSPAEPRDSSLLLVDRGPGRDPLDAVVADLVELVDESTVVVVNRTRVIPARLPMVKPTGGAAEVLLVECRGGGEWEALVRPSRRLREGTVLASVDDPDVSVTVGGVLGDGTRLVHVEVAGRPVGPDEAERALARAGRLPLPPYIRRDLSEPERYQTVFARSPGSAAAPTAGLHLTPRLVDRLAERCLGVVEVELHVGTDTFRPITAADTEDHRMHSERFVVPDRTREAVETAGTVLAVGTTTLRALEADAAGHLGRTDLYVRRGYNFRVVDTLLTNFHLPRSSLLVLLDAFVGPRWKDLYAHALAGPYRFLSFGDAMLVRRDPR